MKRLTLREARDQHEPSFTQEQLEEISGVDQTTISNIELGRIRNPGNNTVEQLEIALGLPRGTLRFVAESEKQSRLPLKRKAS